MSGQMPTGKPVTLKLGPQRANVVISALTNFCISVAEEVRSGDPGAIREQQIAENLRDDISRQLRRAGKESNW